MNPQERTQSKIEGSARGELKSLEAEGRWVFHGSGDELEGLEPRQAFDYSSGEKKPDGEPAVFASIYADYAIFMALVNVANCPKGYDSGVAWNRDGDKVISRFELSQEGLDQLNDKSVGYVYVFDKKGFKPKKEGSVEYLTPDKVTPTKIIKVSRQDLPAVEIIPSS